MVNAGRLASKPMFVTGGASRRTPSGPFLCHREVTREFQREHPSPSTGRTTGAWLVSCVTTSCRARADPTQFRTYTGPPSAMPASKTGGSERLAVADRRASALAANVAALGIRGHDPRRVVVDGAALGTLFLAPLRPGHHHVTRRSIRRRPRMHCRAPSVDCN